MYVTVLPKQHIHVPSLGHGGWECIPFRWRNKCALEKTRRKDVLDGRGEEGMRVGGEGWDREKWTKKGKKVGGEEEIQKLKCHARSLLFFGKSQPAIPDNFNARAIFVFEIYIHSHTTGSAFIWCAFLCIRLYRWRRHFWQRISREGQRFSKIAKFRRQPPSIPSGHLVQQPNAKRAECDQSTLWSLSSLGISTSKVGFGRNRERTGSPCRWGSITRSRLGSRYQRCLVVPQCLCSKT